MEKIILGLLIITVAVNVCFYMLEGGINIQNTPPDKEPICGNKICEDEEWKTCCSSGEGLDVCAPCPNQCPEDCFEHICGNKYCNPREGYVLIEYYNQKVKLNEMEVHGSFYVSKIINETTIEAKIYRDNKKYILGINDEIGTFHVKLLNITLIESEKITCPQDCE